MASNARTPREFKRNAHHWLILHGRYVCTARKARLRALHHRRSVRVPAQGTRLGALLYGSERDDLRRAWVAAWSKSRAGQALEPLERLLAEVISDHPEYHAALESRDALEREFHPEAGQSNPFLHMGLHVAIREQLATDRPPGVRKLYAALLPGFEDAHRLEHALMECLAETLRDAQRSGSVPDEARYLSRARRLGKRRRR